MVLSDIKPEAAQPPSTSMPVLPKFSPLNQRPVYPVLPPNTTQTIFLEHPFERLSPTLATSPCVVDASSMRRASVHPHVSETMQQGLVHSADFFDDGSSDSEWEDRQSSIAQSSTASSDSGLRDLPYDISSDDRSAPRGRSRHRSTITSLLTSPLTHSSGLGTDYSGASDGQASGIIDGRGTSKARQMSLRRLNRDNVRLVDNRSVRSSIESPRLSIQSNNFSPTSPMAILANPTPFSVLGPLEDTLTALPQSPTFRNHRRNTSNSTSDSILADSIINAHVMTMCALEALSLDPRTSGDMSNVPGRTYLHSASTTSWPKSTSFSANRRVTLSPLSTGSVDSHNHRTAQIHSPPIQTPNPFPSTSTNTDLPKPTYRPNHHGSRILHSHFSLRDFSHLSNRNTEEYARLDSACTTQFLFSEGLKTPHDDRKGKYVLGLVPHSTEGFEFRSRLERNKSAQGLVRSCAAEGEGSMVVWVGARRWTWGMERDGCECGGEGGDEGGDRHSSGNARRMLVPILILAMLPSRSPHHNGSDGNNNNNIEKQTNRRSSFLIQNGPTDFDDRTFALGLRAANRKLAGSLFRRAFSARTLSGIRIVHRPIKNDKSNSNSNSNNDAPTSTQVTAEASHESHQAHPNLPSTKTESTIAPLYPSEQDLLTLYKGPVSGRKRYTWVTWARSIAFAHNSCRSSPPFPLPATPTPIPTIEFIYTLSQPRVLFAMALALMLSIAAVVAWVFLGNISEGVIVEHGQAKSVPRALSERVRSGMAIGAFVLLGEACGFGAWITFS